MKATQLLLILLFLGTQSLAALTPGQWQQDQYGGMKYSIYVPSSHQGEPAALMINLHGCAQNAADIQNLGNWEGAAETYNMIVALPQVPNGGVIFGCWDYYDKNHNEKNRHNGPILALTEHLVTDQELNIDRRQVYISGLSSGGSQAMILACMRPDLFTGVGLNAAPTAGTGLWEIAYPRISQQDAQKFCVGLAGNRAPEFAYQMASVIVSDQDSVVNTGHSALNAKVMAAIYSASAGKSLDLNTLAGPNTRGRGTVLADTDGTERVSVIINSGLGHAFPSGKVDNSGRALAAKNYVNPNSVNYPMYLGQFFRENNKRLQAQPNSIR